MRAFIAIELPKKFKDFLSNIQGRLRACGADVKWVEPGNIHLTLKFLGEIDEQTKDKIILIMEKVSDQRQPFHLSLSAPGAFPKITSPRVIWVGTNKGEKDTLEIAKALEEKIEKLGIPKEAKKFSAHITIGRTRSAKNLTNLIKAIQELQEGFKAEENLEFPVAKITLFKSTLTGSGPIYEVLKESTLKIT